MNRQQHSILLLFNNAVCKYVCMYGFYPRDAMLARVIEIATCLSVCLSVTRRYCVKTKKASLMISSPSGSPKTLVFRRQIWSPNSKGFPPNGGLKQGSVVKIQRFSSCKRQYLEYGVLISRTVTEPTLLYYLALSVYISKTVADMAKVTISD